MFKYLNILGVKEDMVIWAKLKQGNGRGTCCWITHSIIIKLKILNYFLML